MIRVYKNDVIQIYDKDMLDGLAYKLYRKTYYEVLQDEKERWEDFVKSFLEIMNPFTEVDFSILCFDSSQDQRNYLRRITCELMNNWIVKEYISDTYLVTDTYKDYFKIGFLGNWQEQRYTNSGKAEEAREFLKSLDFPYKDINITFGKLGCCFTT